MQLRRNIRLFFVNYGRLLFAIFGGLALVIFIVQSVNTYVKETNIPNENIQTTKYTEEEIMQKQKKIKQEKEVVTEYIQQLMEGNTENAYAMLSEECKNEKYETIEQFKEKYVKKYFSIPVISYKIKMEDDRYAIQLLQDPLTTGKREASVTTKLKAQNEILKSTIFIVE